MSLPKIKAKEAKRFIYNEKNKEKYPVIYQTIDKYYTDYVNGQRQYMIEA